VGRSWRTSGPGCGRGERLRGARAAKSGDSGEYKFKKEIGS